MNNIFYNEKVLKKLSAPEDSDDYLKLPNFGIPAIIICVIAFALIIFMFEEL